MNFYAFHIGDYASATRHLTWDEDAAFRRLLDAYYVKEGPLPIELRLVYRLVSASTETQRDAVEIVLQEFFTLTPEGWRNKRCDIEIASKQTKSAKARESGLASAKAKKDRTNAQQGRSTFVDQDDDERSERLIERSDLVDECATPNPTPNKKKYNTPPASRVAPSCRLSADWFPDDQDLQAATAIGLMNGRVRVEAEKFRDWWIAQPGQKGVKADWRATWRTWCRKSMEGHQQARSPPSKETPYQRSMRERVESFAPDIAAKNPETSTFEVIDAEPTTPSRRLGRENI